jgi:hypothetical protein
VKILAPYYYYQKRNYDFDWFYVDVIIGQTIPSPETLGWKLILSRNVLGVNDLCQAVILAV